MDAYPRKRGRAGAAREFAKAWSAGHITEANFGDILEALAAFKQRPKWREKGGQYVPQLTDWIKDRLWEEENAHPRSRLSTTQRRYVSPGAAVNVPPTDIGPQPALEGLTIRDILPGADSEAKRRWDEAFGGKSASASPPAACPSGEPAELLRAQLHQRGYGDAKNYTPPPPNSEAPP